MRTAFLFAAILWALYCARYPCRKSLRAYLIAALVVNIGTEVSLFAFGETARAYAIAYAIFTAIGLLAALNVARDLLAIRWHAIAGAGAALLVVLRAYAGLAKPLHFYDWFALTEGAALTLAGTALLFSAAHHERPKIWLTLGVLWIIQAGFRVGFVLSISSLAWLNLNDWLPTVLVVGAYGFLGMKLKEGGMKTSTQ